MAPGGKFAGFPPAGLQFLRDLVAHNNREFFEAHRQVYEQQLLEPARAFVLELGEKLKSISPGIQFDASSRSGGSILRIHRDVRFSRDKSPYHTQLRLLFWEGPLKRMENPGYFLVFEPQLVTIHAGQHTFDPTHLQAYRRAVVSETSGAALQEIITGLSKGGSYLVGGQSYKKVPQGYPAEHPRAELLKFNGLYASTQAVPPDMLLKPELVLACFEHCRNLAPLHRWLGGLWAQAEV